MDASLQPAMEIYWSDDKGIGLNRIAYLGGSSSCRPSREIMMMSKDPAPEGFMKLGLPVSEELREKVAAEVDEQWKRFKFTNNTLPNLISLYDADGMLNLDVSATDYKSESMKREIVPFLLNPSLNREGLKTDLRNISQEDAVKVAKAIIRRVDAVSIGGITSTKGREYILFGKRASSNRVSVGKLYIDMPAGHIVYDNASGRSTPREAFTWQTNKELGLTPNDFESPTIFAVGRGMTHSYNTMIVGTIDTKLTRKEIEDDFKTKAGDKYETDSLLFVKNDSREMLKMLESYCPRFVDNGLMAALQYMKKEFKLNAYYKAVDSLRVKFGLKVVERPYL